jgi:hypothetical protein
MATRGNLLRAKMVGEMPVGRYMAAALRQRRERAGENLDENAVIWEMTEKNAWEFLRTCSVKQLLLLRRITFGSEALALDDELVRAIEVESIRKRSSERTRMKKANISVVR